MTIQQFREHDYLPGEWNKLLRTNGILQAVLELMEENHPARFAIAGDNNADISPTRANIELGVTRGYSRYGDTLKLLGVRIKKAKDPGETTYAEPPNPEVK